MASELSRRKAEVVAAHHRNAVVIAADTVVILGDRVMGKPAIGVRPNKCSGL